MEEKEDNWISKINTINYNVFSILKYIIVYCIYLF